MINEFEEINNKLKLVDLLKNYTIYIGVFNGKEFTELEVNVLNTDDTVTKIPMNITDIIYLTEHGTMTIPARPILERVVLQIQNNLSNVLEKIIDGIFEKDWTENDVRHSFREFELFINSQIVAIFNEEINKYSYLSNILNIKDENKYLINLHTLKQYITCEIKEF